MTCATSGPHLVLCFRPQENVVSVSVRMPNDDLVRGGLDDLRMRGQRVPVDDRRSDGNLGERRACVQMVGVVRLERRTDRNRFEHRAERVCRQRCRRVRGPELLHGELGGVAKSSRDPHARVHGRFVR